MVKNKSIDDISLDGGLLCLDFINSVANRKEIPIPDYFENFSDVIAWAKRLNIINNEAAEFLSDEAYRNPGKAKTYLTESVTLRESLYSVFQPISIGEKVPSVVMERYNSLLSEYFPSLRIKQTGNGFAKDWALKETSFKKVLAYILNDSYETLLSNKLDRIKECSNCGWLFYDRTKNGKRRWCSMKSCGSNVKSLEWYYRNKEKLK